MKWLSVFDPASEDRPALNPALGRLDAAYAARVADYLSSGEALIRTTQLIPDDVAGPDGDPVVPISTLTDGTYVWNEANAYYVRTYLVSPGDEFLAHCEAAGFVAPILSEAEIDAAMDFVDES